MATESALRKPTDMESMCAVYQELATPGAPHKVLAEMAGSWSVSSVCRMDVDGPPMESSGTAEHKMILDGRFLKQEYSGEMMGGPFSGVGFMGFDNHTGKYVSTWMDTFGTGIYYFEGSAGEDGRTITQTCSYDDPVRGSLVWRSVTRIVDGGTLECEMYTTDSSGREDRMGEMTYTRKG